MPHSTKKKARSAATKATASAPPAYISPTVSCKQTCRALFKKYGIVIGTYSELKKVKMTGYQREHVIPNSCFMKGAGRRGATLDGTGNYSEGEAITYGIYDNQSQGTEHKYLTDKERAYAKELNARGKQATVSEWLDRMEQETRDSLKLKTIERARGEARARATGSDATKLAKCIAAACRSQFKKLKVNFDTPLSNRLAGGGTRTRRVAKKRSRKRK